MNRIVNDPHSRTVEHMIPQVSVSIKRTNGEGDFHVCKKCNSEKSRIDEVLGVICRMVGEHKDGSFDAIKRFHKALARNDSKFIRAFESVESGIKGTSIRLPLAAEEIYRYGIWLGKGVYFIQQGELLPERFLVWVELISHEEVNYIKEQYKRQHASEAFDDLSKNSRIQNINKESFLIAGSNSRVMFICLNRVIMFHIQFLDRTFVNQKKCKKALRSLEKRIKT
ncbi:hypothetical protein [Klebsiella pneumoniae]|uniref:hypothetical protein n=1 Tax=Klebsiella pneumoniae TaxID=573 RepID=UPI001F5F0E7D|nr:hypothetical protein [Klebsiella pneumoniae]MDW1311864.1 hypothetical protein [Klebsiella pneumoniae]